MMLIALGNGKSFTPSFALFFLMIYKCTKKLTWFLSQKQKEQKYDYQFIIP